jgi:hypothetical protein
MELAMANANLDPVSRLRYDIAALRNRIKALRES